MSSSFTPFGVSIVSDPTYEAARPHRGSGLRVMVVFVPSADVSVGMPPWTLYTSCDPSGRVIVCCQVSSPNRWESSKSSVLYVVVRPSAVVTVTVTIGAR